MGFGFLWPFGTGRGHGCSIGQEVPGVLGGIAGFQPTHGCSKFLDWIVASKFAVSVLFLDRAMLCKFRVEVQINHSKNHTIRKMLGTIGSRVPLPDDPHVSELALGSFHSVALAGRTQSLYTWGRLV